MALPQKTIDKIDTLDEKSVAMVVSFVDHLGKIKNNEPVDIKGVFEKARVQCSQRCVLADDDVEESLTHPPTTPTVHPDPSSADPAGGSTGGSYPLTDRNMAGNG